MTGGWGTPSWMGGEPLPGETFVPDKSQETARALLAACDTLETNRQVVRTVTNGFIVPNEVYDQYAAETHGI